MKMDDQEGDGTQTRRASMSRLRSSRRSTVTLGTELLKCIRSMTSRRK